MARNASVLVVDDERDNAINLADILTDLDFEVDVAFDGPSALKLLQDKCYAFALIDYQMPGMDGAELYEQMKKMQPCLVAMMVTAFAGADGVQRALDAGTWKVLRKPIDPHELLTSLGNAADQPLVLLVDDDTEFSQSAWEVLRENGFRVCTADCRADAERKLQQLSFDIVLLDVMLGRDAKGEIESGEQVFQAACQSGRRPTTFLVTGHASEEDAVIQRMLADGASEVFCKPLEIGELIRRMKQAEKSL